MYSKILVPLDGSKLAECALPHAKSLAKNHQSTLILLSVIEPAKIAGWSAGDMEIFQKAMDARRDEAETYLKTIQDTLAAEKLNSEIIIGIDPVVGEIIKVADEHAADLVVLASHGRNGLGRVFFGSVASGVLNRIEKPLMVIHPL